jgi:hypothetical protein
VLILVMQRYPRIYIDFLARAIGFKLVPRERAS